MGMETPPGQGTRGTIPRRELTTGMKAKPQRTGTPSADGTDNAVAGDFIAVNDTGGFSYHRTEQDLIEAFEYIGEATCIIDRAGIQYRLVLGPNRRPMLGQGLGPIDHHWLQEAWPKALKTSGSTYRLRRFRTGNPKEMLSDLFETLSIAHGEKAAEPWILIIDGSETPTKDLAQIDRLLTEQRQLRNVTVKDPFGHSYRPVRHPRHWFQPFTPAFIYYVEVHSQRLP